MKNADNDDEVFRRACDVVDSVIAGNYDIPKEMIYAINYLQDAVYDKLNSDKNNSSIVKHLSPDYVKFRDNARKEREEKFRNLFGCKTIK